MKGQIKSIALFLARVHQNHREFLRVVNLRKKQQHFRIKSYQNGLFMTADLIVIIHFGFIFFVMFGGLLVMKWKWLIYLHLPAAIWGILIEFFWWACPLTTLENYFRHRDSEGEYSIGFIEHYIIPLIYPEGLTHEIQIMLGIGVILLNILIYIGCFKKWANQSGKLSG